MVTGPGLTIPRCISDRDYHLCTRPRVADHLKLLCRPFGLDWDAKDPLSAWVGIVTHPWYSIFLNSNQKALCDLCIFTFYVI